MIFELLYCCFFFYILDSFLAFLEKVAKIVTLEINSHVHPIIH